MEKAKVLGKHTFNFDTKSNGGESLCLYTKIFTNGDDPPDNLHLEHNLTLQSYGNAATFELCCIELTPEKLRKLADELEKEINEAKKIMINGEYYENCGSKK
jgi:hypothetical protein